MTKVFLDSPAEGWEVAWLPAANNFVGKTTLLGSYRDVYRQKCQPLDLPE